MSHSRSSCCWHCYFDSNWTATSSRHLDDAIQAVWRHVLPFYYCLLTLDSMATIGVHLRRPTPEGLSWIRKWYPSLYPQCWGLANRWNVNFEGTIPLSVLCCLALFCSAALLCLSAVESPPNTSTRTVLCYCLWKELEQFTKRPPDLGSGMIGVECKWLWSLWRSTLFMNDGVEMWGKATGSGSFD